MIGNLGSPETSSFLLLEVDHSSVLPRTQYFLYPPDLCKWRVKLNETIKIFIKIYKKYIFGHREPQVNFDVIESVCNFQIYRVNESSITNG